MNAIDLSNQLDLLKHRIDKLVQGEATLQKYIEGVETRYRAAVAMLADVAHNSKSLSKEKFDLICKLIVAEEAKNT
jgi:hypothetical protein